MTPEELANAIQRIETRLEARDTQDTIFTGVVQRIETLLHNHEKMLAEHAEAIGTESEDAYGVRIGTGLRGSVMRLNQRLGPQGWLSQRATGIAMAASVFLVALWWMVQPKLTELFK